MNIYLAAPWVDHDLMPERASRFEAEGHIITHPWWTIDTTLEGKANDDFRTTCAIEDYKGVVESEVVVLFHTAKSEGKAVEQGVALALGIPIIGVGQRGHSVCMNIFHWMPDYIWVDSIDDALIELGRM